MRIWWLAGLGCLSLSGCGISDQQELVSPAVAAVTDSRYQKEEASAPLESVDEHLWADHDQPSATLDLSIPDDHESSGYSASPFKGQADILPDMFAWKPVDEPESTTAFGGRVVMDEETEGYDLSNVRGAELTLEVKTF